MPDTPPFSFANFSNAVNRPSITVAAVVLGVALGIMRFPFLQYLQPIGDFYIAMLQMCVLPFLLATIPLAVRSALTSGTGGRVVGRLVLWLLVTLALVTLIAVAVPAAVFSLMPLDQATTARIGTLFGGIAGRVDIELALNPLLSNAPGAAAEAGLLSVVPTNIFSALSANDSLRVIVFAAIFGAGMVLSERRSGTSIFAALKHIQDVCVLIFDWFNLLTPIGIVALIAPQVAVIGPDIYAVLAPFAIAYLGASAALLAASILVVSVLRRIDARTVFAKLLKPLTLAAATRNSLVCIPSALDAMKQDLRVQSEPCDLYIPVGVATVRFGTMALFATATLFIGYLLGRTFSGLDLLMVAALSIVASFATLGASGLAALAPMAIVLRPFGLSYELALPLMIIVDPITNMVRTVINVALNCQIPALAAGPDAPAASAAAVPSR